MLSLSLSELASLVLPGCLLMKPLAARVSSLVLWRVSLREDRGAAVTCLCPPLVPTSPVHSHQHHVCCLSLCSDLCWTHRTCSSAGSRGRRSWALPRSKEALDGFWGMCRRGSQALERRWEET